MKNNKLSITKKQQEILKLIYRYRFMNRKQIQRLLNHKDKRRIISWLKDLKEKEYIDWHYDNSSLVTKTQPAIYYLSLNGIRYLRNLNVYEDSELRKRYKDSKRSQSFIDRSILIVDCVISLKDKSDINENLNYLYVLPSDYIDEDNDYHFLNELKPHLYVERKAEEEETIYLLESFDSTLPRYQVRKRIKDYIEQLQTWDGDSPIVLFVCTDTADLLYVKRRIRYELEEMDEEDLVFRVTALDKIKLNGMVGMVWEDV